ncbi:MAG: transposase [Candidatus Omnitrophica bacterium]|nr:transposase [Candidatus Omnitrophota bacterium]
MSRIARLVAVDYPHHIIQRGNNRRNVFLSDDDRQHYLRLLAKYSEECACKVKAFCLMSNHVHLLLVPTDKTALAKAMQKISLSYTQYVNRKYKRTGRLWECRFHSSIVDDDIYLLSVCRYIEKNPTRAGVAKRAESYRWSSVRVNTNTTSREYKFLDPIWRDYNIDCQQYKSFLEEDAAAYSIKNKNITQYTYTGKPLGSKDFIKKLSATLGREILIERKRGRPGKNGMCPEFKQQLSF